MLSLILPTYNEAENLPELLPKISEVLSGIPYEIIIVDDDSPDETWKVGQELAHDREDLHVIRRIGRRGLSSAVIEGFLAAKGNVLAVMDADGQHDTELLKTLYEAVQSGVGIVLGSRYTEGGSVGQWDERRHLMSKVATTAAIKLCRVPVKDPMSGFFAIKRSVFEGVLNQLNPKGFKILLDILVRIPKDTVVQELPFTFRERMHGESKLSRQVQIECMEHLYDVTFGRFIPLTFVKFCIVGTLGVFVHVGAYMFYSHLLKNGGDISLFGFSLAVIGATETAIVFNYLLNNVWTFAHARLRGVAALFGFFKFNIACGFGALANYAVAAYLFSIGWTELIAVLLGAFTSVIWNYTMNKLLTWRA